MAKNHKQITQGEKLPPDEMASLAADIKAVEWAILAPDWPMPKGLPVDVRLCGPWYEGCPPVILSSDRGFYCPVCAKPLRTTGGFDKHVIARHGWHRIDSRYNTYPPNVKKSVPCKQLPELPPVRMPIKGPGLGTVEINGILYRVYRDPGGWVSANRKGFLDYTTRMIYISNEVKAVGLVPFLQSVVEFVRKEHLNLPCACDHCGLICPSGDALAEHVSTEHQHADADDDDDDGEEWKSAT